MHRTLSILALLAAGVVPAAGQELSFTDITEQAGTGGPTAPNRLGGHGVMFGDVDGDGLPDLYITMNFNDPMPDLFFRNRGGGRFVEEGRRRGLIDFDGGVHGTCFADLDNDGDYDLVKGVTFGSQRSTPPVNGVYRNEGRGVFTNITAKSGLPGQPAWPTRGLVACDVNGNGRLDLFGVTNYLGSDDPPEERNEAWRNQGKMRFTPLGDPVLLRSPCGQGVTDADFDGDGAVDLLAANRTGDVNILRNDGQGCFTRIKPASIGIRHRAGDGISLADVNNNGHLDLLLASANSGHLYENNGDGTFTFRQSFSETSGYMGGFADLDNDGFVDLVFAGENKVYRNDATGRFVPGPAVPVDGINDPRAIAFADIDSDGDLDFAIGCKRSRNWLVRNNFDGGNWLKVRLISPQGQAGAFGAKVCIYSRGSTEADDARLRGMREARSNSGYLAQDDPVLHFGLGEAEKVDLVVKFLDGTRIARRAVASGQTVLIDGRDPKDAP